MLTLVATCFLAGQLLFAVPDGWRVTEVYSGGARPFSNAMTLVYCPAECEAVRQKPYVKLVREMHAGESANLPQGCEVTGKAKEK